MDYGTTSATDWLASLRANLGKKCVSLRTLYLTTFLFTKPLIRCAYPATRSAVIGFIEAFKLIYILSML